MPETNQSNTETTQTRIVYSASEMGIVDRAYSKGGKIQFDGWLSRENVDYYGTIFEAEGARKYFDRFLANPVICFNHDLNIPLGRATNPMIKTGDGIYLEGVVLSDIPVVRDTIAPLIEDNVLGQMSIQAAVFDYVTGSDGVPRFTEYLIMEGSVVTVAGNHKATIDPASIKSLARNLNLDLGKAHVESIDDIVSKYLTGEIQKKRVYTGYSMPEQIATPIFSIRTQPSHVVPADETTQGSLHFSVRRDLEGSSTDMYPVGYITEAGELAVSRNHMAISLCQLFGARNSEALSMDDEVRVKAIRNILDLYKSQEMTEPSLGEVGLSEISDEVLKGLQFRNVKWNENESRILMFDMIRSNAVNLKNGITGIKDPSEEELRTLSDLVMPMVSRWVDLYVGVSGYAYSESEMEFWEEIIEKIKELRYPKETQTLEDSMPALRETPEQEKPVKIELVIPELGI